MGEFHGFLAVDRQLTDADRKELRSVSTRARITGTSFANSYDFGSFKGDPEKFMRRWFDIHLYAADWDTRRVMFRFPSRLVDVQGLDEFLMNVEFVRVLTSGKNLIVDIHRSGEDDGYDPDDGFDGEDDGAGRLAELAVLRGAVLAGDLRLFYLLWLTSLDDPELLDSGLEPLTGLGLVTGELQTFAEIIGADPDLVDAAAECPAGARPAASARMSVRQAIASLPESEKAAMLGRLHDGDPHVAAEIQALVRKQVSAVSGSAHDTRRTVGELRARALEIRTARERVEAEKEAAERERKARQEAAERARALDAGRKQPRSGARTVARRTGNQTRTR